MNPVQISKIHLLHFPKKLLRQSTNKPLARTLVMEIATCDLRPHPTLIFLRHHLAPQPPPGLLRKASTKPTTVGRRGPVQWSGPAGGPHPITATTFRSAKQPKRRKGNAWHHPTGTEAHDRCRNRQMWKGKLRKAVLQQNA